MPPIIMLLKSPWTFQQAASGPNRPGSPFGDSKSTPPTASPVRLSTWLSIWRRTLSMGARYDRAGTSLTQAPERLEPSRAAGRRDGCVGQRLTRLSINPCTTPGSARVEVSPRLSSSLQAILRRIRRMILPERVFGRLGAHCR